MNLLSLLRSIVMYRWRPMRRRTMRAHYRQFVGPGDLVFDVGAHVGNRTSAFAALGARVVAIEPQPGLARFLTRFVSHHGAVEVVASAVGADEREVELHLSPRNLTVATTSPEWARRLTEQPGWERVKLDATIRVKQTTLDRLIETYGTPAFVKVDAEGSEDEVLAGLSRPVPALSCEFLPADRDVAFHAVIRLEHLAARFGVEYEYNFVLGESLRLVLPNRWWSAAELNEYLSEIPGDGPSGDIYARLIGAAP